MLPRGILWLVFFAGGFILIGTCFTRLLTTEDYGRVAIYSAWLGILNLFIGLQTHGSIANASIKYEGKMDSYLSSIMTLSFLSFVFVLCVFVIFQKYLCQLLDMQCSLMFLLVVHTFFSFVVNFYTAKWIQFRDVEKNTIVSILISGGTVVLSIIFILYLNVESYRAKIYGTAVPQVISGFVFYKNFEYNFGFYIKGMLPTMTVVIAYYFTLNFWLIRWLFAVVVDFVLLRRIIINKALF